MLPPPGNTKRVSDEAVCLSAKLTDTNHLSAVHSANNTLISQEFITIGRSRCYASTLNQLFFFFFFYTST